jgi:hypothetical protein
LRDKPVITLIACRNMWLMAQEVMKEKLARLGARLIDNAALVDRAHPAATFISTPLWMLTGKRGPFLERPCASCRYSFGRHIAASRVVLVQPLPHNCLHASQEDNAPMLKGLGAVTINERLIASEKIARRSFVSGENYCEPWVMPSSPLRQTVLCLYIVFLVAMILTVVPISAVIKRLLSPFTRERIAQQRQYFAQPSGED